MECDPYWKSGKYVDDRWYVTVSSPYGWAFKTLSCTEVGKCCSLIMVKKKQERREKLSLLQV